MGDIVHALPVLAAIKKAIPDAQVDWLVEENYASILSIAQACIAASSSGRDDSFATPDSDFVRRSARLSRRREVPVEPGLRRRARSAGTDQVGDLGAHLVRESGVGFDEANLREPQAAFLYSETVTPKNRPTGQQADGPLMDSTSSRRICRFCRRLQIKPGAHRSAAGAAGVG